MSSSIKKEIRGALLLSACAGFALIASHQPANAAGFYLQEHSVSDLGTAYSGSTTVANDASTVYYNPAGMTALGKGQVNIDGTLIMPSADLTNTGSTLLGGPVGGPDSDNPVPVTALPSAFAAYPFMDGRVWAGLGFSTPFGLSTKYSSNWYGRYDSIKSDLKTYDFQPTVAFKVNQYLSIGGGADIQYATADLTNAITDGLAQGLAQVKGNDTSYGWTGGILVTPQPGTRIGFDYRSAIHHKIKGTLNVSGTVALNENSDASADLDLPQVATIGVAQDFGPQWTVTGQAQWFGWNDFNQLQVVRSNGSIAETIQENYRNTTNFSIGAAYKWRSDLTVRGGYQYDPTPTRDGFRDTRVPDSTRNWLTAGATYDITPGISVDLSGAYIFMGDTSISVTRNAGFAKVNADISNSSIALAALGLNFKF